jgi:hypothetical protein
MKLSISSLQLDSRFSSFQFDSALLVLVVLGFEFRALCLRGRHSATQAMPLDFSALGIFQIGSSHL